MKLTRITVVAFAALLFATPAQAQDFMFKPYVGGGIGAYELDYGNGTDFVVGGYGALGADLHEFLAVEARFGSAGSKSKADTGTALIGNVKAEIGWFCLLPGSNHVLKLLMGCVSTAFWEPVR